MKVDIEKVEREVKVIQEKEVFYLELTRDEATLILLCLSDRSSGSVADRLNKVRLSNHYTDNYKKSISLIENEESFPDPLIDIFDELAEELAK